MFLYKELFLDVPVSNQLISLASREGCEKLVSSAAKGASFQSINFPSE